MDLQSSLLQCDHHKSNSMRVVPASLSLKPGFFLMTLQWFWDACDINPLISGFFPPILHLFVR
jgi:hypothetical protein